MVASSNRPQTHHFHQAGRLNRRRSRSGVGMARGGTSGGYGSSQPVYKGAGENATTPVSATEVPGAGVAIRLKGRRTSSGTSADDLDVGQLHVLAGHLVQDDRVPGHLPLRLGDVVFARPAAQ